MSQHLKKNKAFLLLLIGKNITVANRIIQTSSEGELRAIAEILHNIGILPLSSKTEFVKKHYKLLTKTLQSIKKYIRF